jgi:hypothetical protein
LSQSPLDRLLLEEIAEHVASGVIIHVATRNASLGRIALDERASAA